MSILLHEKEKTNIAIFLKLCKLSRPKYIQACTVRMYIQPFLAMYFSRYDTHHLLTTFKKRVLTYTTLWYHMNFKENSSNHLYLDQGRLRIFFMSGTIATDCSWLLVSKACYKQMLVSCLARANAIRQSEQLVCLTPCWTPNQYPILIGWLPNVRMWILTPVANCWQLSTWVLNPPIPFCHNFAR